MGIPERQLETWSNPGATRTAINAHEAIRNALATSNYEIYLQGSYANSTNTWGSSDVDVAVQLNFVRPEQSYNPVSYASWDRHRLNVLVALRAYFGSGEVNEGNKSLKLRGNSSRQSADVVPSIQFSADKTIGVKAYRIEGIQFYSRNTASLIVNFPKAHREWGEWKNRRDQTSGNWKPSVRMFKNARTALLEARVISADLAPSYFVECLLFNVPNSCFRAGRGETYCAVVNWLSETRIDNLELQNQMGALFGRSQEQWSGDRAHALIAALTRLWNEWA